MKETLTSQKLRGGYYTPQPIADFLARWAVRSPDAVILEPSFGDGNLLIAAAKNLRALGADSQKIARQLHGVELEEDEANKAIQRLTHITNGCLPESIYVGDFLGYAQENLFVEPTLVGILTPNVTFDAIIGNPPFIRYQNFPEEFRSIAVHLMEYAGFKPSGLMNTWLPFLVI